MFARRAYPNLGSNLIFPVLHTDITTDTAENYYEPTCKLSLGTSRDLLSIFDSQGIKSMQICYKILKKL